MFHLTHIQKTPIYSPARLVVLPQVISMEDSSEQSHWVSPSLLSSDHLGAFSSEPGLLPPGEEGEAFFSGQDSDYTSLPSFFSNPSHSRAPSTYRHSSGQCSHPLPLPLHHTHLLNHDAFKMLMRAVDDFASFVPRSTVRQVFSSPSLLSNFQLLDTPGSHSLGSPYNPPASTWSSSPLTKTPLHSHTPTSLYTPSITSSFTASRDGYSSPNRDGRESPRLQEALKAERMSPLGGLGASSSFLNLTPAAGSVYTSSSHSHPHMLSPYSSYMSGPQEYSSALYSSPGAWISPSYSPKMRNKMRISTPGESTPRHVIFCVCMLSCP